MNRGINLYISRKLPFFGGLFVKGIILAGGLGRRLRPITNTGPKQLIPIANKPMIFYPIEELVKSGIKDIAIIVGYTPERIGAIKGACGDGSRWNAGITYIEQDAPRGIAHAIYICREFVKNDDFCVYFGDNLLKKGFSNFVDQFKKSDADCSLLLTEVGKPEHYGIAHIDEDGNVIDVEEKPRNPKSNYAITGIYLFRKSFYDVYPKIKPSWRGELEVTDVIKELIKDKSYKVISNFVKGWWRDTGQSDDILEGNHLVLSDIQTKIEGHIDKSVTVHGTLILGKGSEIKDNAIITGPVIIGSNTAIGSQAKIGPYTSIGNKCTILEAHIESSIVMDGCQIDFKRKISNSLIGKKVKLGQKPAGEKNHALKMVLGENSEVRE